jgi:hypothetical protein
VVVALTLATRVVFMAGFVSDVTKLVTLISGLLAIGASLATTIDGMVCDASSCSPCVVLGSCMS